MKKLLIFVLGLFLLSSCGTGSDSADNNAPYNEILHEVSIERVDKSVFADNGGILAHIYFDKPIVSGDSDAAAKINALFEQACKEWLGESSDNEALTKDVSFPTDYGLYSDILDVLDHYRTNMGDDYLLQPGYALKNILYSEVRLSDKETLSIMHVSDWYAGGVRSFRIYGSTFDMKTGELVQCPVDLDDLMLKEQLTSVLHENSAMEITSKYYRDENYIYVIIQGRDDYVVKWNGKTGADFEAEWQEWDWLDKIPD